jgi:transposase
MDETGWRVGGVNAWLWVAVAELVTVYAIRRGRGFEEAAELIGKDYAGLLVRDGWGPHRGFKAALHQTCAAHLLRRCREMLEVARGRGREIPRAVKTILSGALKLRDQRDAGEIAEADFQFELDKLEQQLRALLARPVSGADNPQGRLLRHLGREFDALFTFLHLPGGAGHHLDGRAGAPPSGGQPQGLGRQPNLERRQSSGAPDDRPPHSSPTAS